jgi:2-O-methyltransferase
VFEPEITPGQLNLNFLPQLIGKPDPVILDIGCNDGTHTIAFLKLFPFSRVYAFEPDPRAFEIFQSRIRGERVQLFDFAISDADGIADFHLSDGFPTPEFKDYRPTGWDLSGSIHRPKEHLNVYPWCEFNREIKVKTRSLDSWRAETGVESIDFIWADVQGAEHNLIAGGRNTLENTRYFYTEYSNTELYESQVGLEWIMEKLPGFDVLYRFSEDVLMKNRSFA